MTVGPAYAASAAPCHVSGTFLEDAIPPGGLVSDAVHGNTEITRFNHPIDLSGSMSGTGNAQEQSVVHLQNGAFEAHLTYAFEGTVTCEGSSTARSGGLVINFNAHGNYFPDPGHFTATFEIIGSSGGLTGTHGGGTVTGIPGVPGGTGPYDGILR